MCQQYFFLRHGTVEPEQILLGQSIDARLSKAGREQAIRWAEALRKVPFQAIVTSPAGRAQETAEAFMRDNLPVLRLPHFHEFNWGEWEGLAYEKARPLLEEQQKRWEANDMDWAPPQGESLKMVFLRIDEGLRLLASLYPTGSLLIITHGQLLRLLMIRLFAYPISAQRLFYHKRGQLSWLVRLPEGHFYLRALAVDADTAF
ncbi:MAG: histidine phosphatase family protein [Bacteroidia bacterium]|nr:histidine phosphatase family protein [Bacteroidia bacterium]MCX7651741.1 histidine phosphatase family protein [Bacteroidia bacterium]MDW8417379.1 histidine phosphatase family protein [Bacteroidia bacterium]